MGSNFFDIPFRLPSSESDFSCKDGEIVEASNLLVGDEDVSGILSPDHSSDTPPVPLVDFALVRDILKGWHMMADDFPAKTLNASTPSMEYWNQMAAQLLTQFKTDASRQHLFVAPFYALAAWKMADGRYLSISTPSLLIPNSDVPLVATFEEISAMEIEMRIAAAVCSLYFKMKAPEQLRQWVGKILSLEIFVSSPLHNYDTYNSLLPFRRATTLSYCRQLDLSSGDISDVRVCNVTLPQAWRANIKGIGEEDLNDAGIVSENSLYELTFYPFATLPLSRIDIADKWGKAGQSGIGDHLYSGIMKGISFKELVSSVQSTNTSSKPITLRGKGEEFRVITRPIKLSGAGAWKQVIRGFLRGNYSPASVILCIYGSRDMLKWWKIGERRGGSVVFLPHSFFRFYKVEVSGTLAEGETLEGFNLG